MEEELRFAATRKLADFTQLPQRQPTLAVGKLGATPTSAVCPVLPEHSQAQALHRLRLRWLRRWGRGLSETKSSQQSLQTRPRHASVHFHSLVSLQTCRRLSTASGWKVRWLQTRREQVPPVLAAALKAVAVLPRAHSLWSLGTQV